MVEKIALPRNPTCFGRVFFKFPDAFPHAELAIETQNGVQMIWHENQQMNPKITAGLIKIERLMKHLRGFVFTQLISSAGRTAYGDEIFRSIVNP